MTICVNDVVLSTDGGAFLPAMNGRGFQRRFL